MRRLAIALLLCFSSAGAQTLCPDGTYVGGDRCQLAPDGSYVGVYDEHDDLYLGPRRIGRDRESDSKIHDGDSGGLITLRRRQPISDFSFGNVCDIDEDERWRIQLNLLASLRESWPSLSENVHEKLLESARRDHALQNEACAEIEEAMTE